MKMSEGKDLCAFCRMPPPFSDEDHKKRVKKLTDNNHPYSFNFLAGEYEYGLRGLPQDHQKAIELWLKAWELGCAGAYYNLGVAYDQGTGVEIDKKKAKHYYELATMGGDIMARHNLGMMEGQAGNNERALKHFILTARAGDKESLAAVKNGFKAGMVTKDEYASILRAHQQRLDEIKSVERDKAEASGI